MNSKSLVFGTMLALGMMSTSASATTFFGNTSGEPTWNRPIGDGPLLSNVGRAVSYQTTSFTVDANGSYSFALNRLTRRFDTYLFLYENSFDPTSQLTNLLAGNDDGGSSTNSAFNFGLNSGTSYFAVASGYNNRDVGRYSLAIEGPGNVAGAVPEPATWAFMIFGFGAIGGAMRSRRKANVKVSYA